MQAIETTAHIDNKGFISIQKPLAVKNKDVKIIVLMNENLPTQKKYDFSDMIGKLKWKGDALAEQKKLRNEWS
jgi:hypothetical protein